MCLGRVFILMGMCDEKAFAVVPSVDLDSCGLLKSWPVSGWMEGKGS